MGMNGCFLPNAKSVFTKCKKNIRDYLLTFAPKFNKS